MMHARAILRIHRLVLRAHKIEEWVLHLGSQGGVKIHVRRRSHVREWWSMHRMARMVHRVAGRERSVHRHRKSGRIKRRRRRMVRLRHVRRFASWRT